MKNEAISIRLPPDIRQALTDLAVRENRTLSNLVLCAIKEYLENSKILTAFEQYLKDNEPPR